MDYLLVASTCFWYFLYRLSPNNITRNYLSAVHATFIVTSYLFVSNIEYLYYPSIGYYIADCLHEINGIYHSNNIELTQIGIVIHHIIMLLGLGTLFDPANAQYFYKAYWLAEISNYPLYIRSHLRNKKILNTFVTIIVIFFQVLLFIVLRLWLCGIIMYDMYNNNAMNMPLYIMSSTLYIMSAIWTYMLSKQFLYKIGLHF